MIQVKWFFFHSVTNSLYLAQVHFILLYINFNMLSVILCFSNIVPHVSWIKCKIMAQIFVLTCIFGWSENLCALISHSFWLDVWNLLIVSLFTKRTAKIAKIRDSTMHVKICSRLTVLPRHTIISKCGNSRSTIFLVRLFIDSKSYVQLKSVGTNNTHAYELAQEKKIVGLVIFDTFFIELLIIALIKIKSFDSS